MKEYKFRILIDSLEEENAFRDISINSTYTFDKLPKKSTEVFNFKGDEVASFYLSNEDWDKGQEIGLMDMTGESAEFLQMTDTTIGELVNELNQKLLYVYDFLTMWCFFVELVEINPIDSSKNYPNLELTFGKAPAEDSKQIEMVDSLDYLDEDEESDYNEFEDDLDIDDYDNLDFDENWN